MALPLPTGLTPPEIAFLCENELVTVIPRQRLESLELLSGPTPSLLPPRTVALPLWLALLLHRQRRANIVPPPWLTVSSLEAILKAEIDNAESFSPSPPFPSSGVANAHPSAHNEIVSPPFLPHNLATSSASALPYHWMELSEILLTASAESFQNAGQVRGLLRDLREVRMSKLRSGMRGLEGGGLFSLRGVGALEVASERAFVVGVVGGLRDLGGSREAARREAEVEGGVDGRGDNGDEEDGMDF